MPVLIYIFTLFVFHCDSCVTMCVTDVTPSAVHVGNIIQGMRLASAQGRDIGMMEDDTDTAKKV